ncbi:(2Fe-2S)-binding protein [Arthrobacter alpinus]|uniref:(2Fe-2S)-binding protein n=1 Tax=Arthrobacter alpinus TaxID=656366 RepID=UPI0009EB5BFB|nr:(2Fe-2S)-binding protein [Arthrobacter alpinus]
MPKTNAPGIKLPEILLTLDGVPVTARPGQTVAAVLIEAGITSWRTTRKEGRPRGLFCGIGICFDCLVTADGVPNQRACLTPARDGMALKTGRLTSETAAGAGVAPTVDPTGSLTAAPTADEVKSNDV